MSEEIVDDIGSDIRAAMQAGETPAATPAPAPAPVPTPVPTPAAATNSDRDEAGRFKAKEAVVETPAATPSPTPAAVTPGPAPTPAAATGEEGVWKQDKAPQSWTPAVREKWATIDPEIRAEIVRREEAAVTGVRQLQERYAPMDQLANSIGPYMNEIVQQGQNPNAYLQATLAAEKELRAADVPSRFQALLKIADNYGIPLRDIINKSVGEEVLGPMAKVQIPQEITNELQEQRQWRQQQEANYAQSAYNSFASDPKNEFFNDVRNQMADLIDAGVAKTLPEAYEAAIWANPTTRAVLVGRQGQQQQNTGIVDRQKAAAGASVVATGDLKVAPGAMGHSDDDDLATTVAKAIRDNAGRV